MSLARSFLTESWNNFSSFSLLKLAIGFYNREEKVGGTLLCPVYLTGWLERVTATFSLFLCSYGE